MGKTSWISSFCVYLGGLLCVVMLTMGACAPAVTPGTDGTLGDGGLDRDGIRPDESGGDKAPTDTRLPDNGTSETSPDASPDSTPTDNTPGPDRSPPEGRTDEPSLPQDRCYSVLVCAEARCAWPYPIDCLDQCSRRVQVTGDASRRYNALRGCIVRQCTGVCDPKDSACHVNCVAANCAKEWTGCATDGQVGQRSCKEVFDCATPCQPKVGPCHARCVAAGTQQAQEQYTKGLTCQGLIGLGTLTQKQRDDCNYNTALCLCPSYIQGGQGASTCGGYFACTDQCKGDDVCCYAKCRHETNQDELKAADAAAACMAQHCSACQGTQPCTSQCAINHCLEPYRSCVCPRSGRPGAGSDSCTSALQCQCSNNDTCCQFRCLNKLDQQGLKLYLSVVSCGAQCNCSAGDKACNDKCYGAGGPCQKQAQACLADR